MRGRNLGTNAASARLKLLISKVDPLVLLWQIDPKLQLAGKGDTRRMYGHLNMNDYERMLIIIECKLIVLNIY